MADVTTKFPNPFASPEVKNSDKYCKQFAEAFHAEAGNSTIDNNLSRNSKSQNQFKRMRLYARGEQSQLQYKELMGLKKEKGDIDANGSFRNINFEILKVAPKIRNVVVNKIVNQPMRMTAKAVDPKSLSERRKYKSKLLEFIINKEAIEQFENLTKMGLERPVPAGEQPPSSAVEIDPYIDMNPKDVTSMEVLDFITLNFHENDWTQQGREIAGDLVDYGYGGTRQFIDVDNKIKFRRILIERAIANKCVFPDFRDLTRFGEYMDINVADLKRKTRNKWPEQTYMDIANKVAGNSSYGGAPQAHYNADTFTYAYDDEKITVLDCLWYSVDTQVSLEYMNEAGNRRVKSMAHDYIPFRGDKNVNEGRGMGDQEYNKFNGGKKQIHRTEKRNVYQCCWIVNTDFVYDNGLMKNMLVPASNWQETIMPVTLISTDFVSTMGIIERPLDDVQLNYLQYQSHTAASKPPGIAVEKHALARLNKGKAKWDPKKALELYAESGNLVYDGYDEHDNPLNMLPFKELTNGLSEGAQEHFQLMMQFIDLIKQMLGLNIMTEGQTPPERLGKTVAQLSYGASDNALSHLSAAYKSVYEKTARNVFYLLQDNVQRMDPDQISESLGAESYKYFMLNQDLGLKDMGIILEEGPDDAVREKISELLNLMVTNGEIPGEDAIMIQMVDNPYRQVLMLRKHRIEKQEKDFQQQQSLVQQQGEQNTQTAVALEQEKQKASEVESQRRMEELQAVEMMKQEQRKMEMLHEIILKKLDGTAEEKLQAEALANSWAEALLKSSTEIQKQRLQNQKAKATK